MVTYFFIGFKEQFYKGCINNFKVPASFSIKCKPLHSIPSKKKRERRKRNTRMFARKLKVFYTVLFLCSKFTWVGEAEVEKQSHGHGRSRQTWHSLLSYHELYLPFVCLTDQTWEVRCAGRHLQQSYSALNNAIHSGLGREKNYFEKIYRE